MNCPGCRAVAEPGQRFCRQCGTPLDGADTPVAASPGQAPDAGPGSGQGTQTAGMEMVGRACPYCRFPLKEGVPVVTCGSCSSVHHSECWEENGGCAVTGCVAGPQPQTRVLQRPMPPPSAPPPRPGPAPSGAPPPPFHPPPPPSAGRTGMSAALTVALATVVVVLGAGVAIALTSGGGSPTPTVAPPVTTDAAVSTESPATESTPEEPAQPAETESTPPVSTDTPPPPPPPPTPGPVEAIESYWHDIAAHDFAGAFHVEEPFATANGFTESHWIEIEENEGVKSIVHRFSLGEENGESATVDVDQLRTRASRTGCFTWTGGYGMTRKGGEWFITSDNLERHGC